MHFSIFLQDEYFAKGVWKGNLRFDLHESLLVAVPFAHQNLHYINNIDFMNAVLIVKSPKYNSHKIR